MVKRSCRCKEICLQPVSLLDCRLRGTIKDLTEFTSGILHIFRVSMLLQGRSGKHTSRGLQKACKYLFPSLQDSRTASCYSDLLLLVRAMYYTEATSECIQLPYRATSVRNKDYYLDTGQSSLPMSWRYTWASFLSFFTS